MMSRHHSGFHVHIGERIWPEDEQGLGNLTRYIIRACFSQERMVYIPVGESTDDFLHLPKGKKWPTSIYLVVDLFKLKRFSWQIRSSYKGGGLKLSVVISLHNQHAEIMWLSPLYHAEHSPEIS